LDENVVAADVPERAGPGGEQEALRQRHVAEFEAMFSGYAARVDWPEDLVRAERLRALRVLLATADRRSPWHRERLAGFDLEAFCEADIASLPVMTKTDLMDNFDSIVTDRRVTRELCERHLHELTGDGYLLGEYHVVASGGSSGQRGVFVYGWDAWAVCWASMVRFPERDWARDRVLEGVPRVAAVVAAARATHVSAAFRHSFSSPRIREHLIPVSQPLAQIVASLNQLQPTELIGYGSFLPRLAGEARAGRLHISPRRVMAIAEPLFPEARAAVLEVWDVPVGSRYGMSEGLFSGFCGHGSHLPDDLCLFEPVGAGGQPVPPGVASHQVYVTNLYNHALPLIRFELSDEVTVLDGSCPCGSAFRRIADPQGRLDDTFVYTRGVSIHPHVFRSSLGQYRPIVEYQVRQTERGADIRVVAEAQVDTALIEHTIGQALAALGLDQPEVTITLEPALDRQVTGKLKRFVPLSG
jgi:phenylacetate-CoA ligase